jgi:hypothetical protein
VTAHRTEPGERLGHSHESLAAAARLLAVDVWTGALADPSGALKWLAVGGTAVMTTDARRALMHEVNERKQAAEAAAAAEQQRAADAAAAKASGAAGTQSGGAAGNASALPHAPVRAAAASAAPAAVANRVAAVAAAPGAAVGAGRLQLMAASLRGALQCVPGAAACQRMLRADACPRLSCPARAADAGAAAPLRALTPKPQRSLR